MNKVRFSAPTLKQNYLAKWAKRKPANTVLIIIRICVLKQ